MERRKGALLVLAIISVIWSLLPIYWLLNMSFMFPAEIFAVPAHLFPQDPTPNNYLRAFGYPTYDPKTGAELTRGGGHSVYITGGLLNSFMIAVPVTLLTIALASPAGYAFGRIGFAHKNKLLFLLIGSRSLPPVSILVPYFLIYFMLGLVGTHLGMILIYLSITVPLITWVLMGFFATLPVETERAARIDGCTRFQAFLKVVLPMARPGIASCTMLAFLISWNEFMFAWILAGGSPAQTIPPALASMFYQWAEIELMSAANTIAIIPPIIIAMIFQKYITQLRIVDPVTVVGA